ncbi:hypothetical protein [Candidatus Uabimicrobium amorphum]|uniref:Alpha-amylase n=1 Tax=Uabimicrobium amorphum TaxID=2596890 RepID=A0A5S9F6S6_UABAM|nr:hypothetical protein [Candidatus Uabimicrobium amorphum]BBM86944.1 alpha-amylase [Candidatus Uabimicrobium amorphum]
MKKFLIIVLLLSFCIFAQDDNSENTRKKVAATHLYHMHMPNFWPYFDVNSYDSIPNGERIQYKLDGDIILWKEAGKKLPFTPHDDLRTYYAHDAKQNGYTNRPPNKIRENNSRWPMSGAQLTFSGSLMTNVENLAALNIHFWPNWAGNFRDVYYNTKTQNGFRALDFVYFTYHHSMGPLIGPEYFEKELRMHEHISGASFFMGQGYKASKGFFPTELGFSERLIPTLRKLGIEWSFVSNVHLSRALADYPNVDLTHTNNLISPPNKAYMTNTSGQGKWHIEPIFNQNREVTNKYPFSALPHWAKYVDPASGKEDKIIVVPANQAASWQEGFMQVGPELADNVVANAGSTNRQCIFVTAKDGDNSSGYGSGQDGYNNSTRIYSGGSIEPMTVQEYLRKNPVPQDDVVRVEDGSWIDTGDSPGDQNWYHWQLPPGRWQHPQKKGSEPFTADLETGYHFQMRFYALLQAYLNYAITAEQIQVDFNNGAPLRIDQITNPIKGNANFAELGWYFLSSSLDSGFAYYGENVDDTMKPIVGMENSLHFTKKFVEEHKDKDKTGPTMWWVQRWPTNPGGLNRDKSTGWVKRTFNNHFAIYTYAYDVAGIDKVTLKIRVDNDGVNPIGDNANEVYDPNSVPSVNANAVGSWVEYDMTRRKLPPNGMPRDKNYNDKYYNPLPASICGELYYTYLEDYENCLIDYYIEAVDSRGNVKRSEIQHVWIGNRQGINPFVTPVDRIKITQATTNPKSGQTGEKVTFNVTAQLEQDNEGHPHEKVLRLYFERATAKSHVAHWWFRETSNGPAIAPDAAYLHPEFKHKVGSDGKSIDSEMKYDADKDKYYVEIGPFTKEQRPKYIGHMLGAPLWTEQAETKIHYSVNAKDIVVEIDFSAIGEGKQKMELTSMKDNEYFFVLQKTIKGNSGNYSFPITARVGSDVTKKSYSFKYEIE